MRDSQLFNKEWYYRNARALRSFLQKINLRGSRK
jgi:hypothetical protein